MKDEQPVGLLSDHSNLTAPQDIFGGPADQY